MRAITTRRLTASIVNVTIGAGIFVLPAVVAGELGAAAPTAYLVCAVAMGLVVTCFAAAGSRVSATGGLYAFVEAAFGPLVGFMSGVLYWLAAAFSAASVANAFAASLAVVLPAAASGAGRAAVLLLLFGGLAAINVRGVTAGIRLVELMAAAKLLPLALLVVAGLWSTPFERADLATWVTPPAAADVGRASIVLIFAFIGIELALVPSGEFRNPARTVPVAVFLALAVTTTVYLLLQAVVQQVLGDSLSTYAAAPLAEAAARVLGPAGHALMLAGATVSMFGYVSGDVLGTPRALYALALRNLLPMRLAAVHPRFRTPAAAIVAHAAAVGSMAISSSFTSLAIVANIATLSLYLLGVAAAYELQRRDVRAGAHAAPFVLPGGPMIPAAGSMVVLWLLWQATLREWLIEAVVIAAAVTVYVVRRRSVAALPLPAAPAE